MNVDDHDAICLESMEKEQALAASLSIALVSRDGALPPSLTTLRLRAKGGPSAVLPSDDVAICYSEAPAADVRDLCRTLGRDTPAVLVAARRFDPQDVIASFGFGATSYLVLTQTPEVCLLDASITTARGQSCISPVAATALLKHMHRATFTAPIEPPGGNLTRRERQIMEVLVTGHTIAEIAELLSLTGKTVRNNLSSIYAKLQVRRQSEAILLWLQKRPPAVTISAPDGLAWTDLQRRQHLEIP